ncbi:hypothetical protein HK102_011864 [Quaeritorhiza haematococci]|nr:hypothetical protein HK102_011864 [Quaeritorhiza haematococci]
MREERDWFQQVDDDWDDNEVDDGLGEPSPYTHQILSDAGSVLDDDCNMLRELPPSTESASPSHGLSDQNVDQLAPKASEESSLEPRGCNRRCLESAPTTLQDSRRPQGQTYLRKALSDVLNWSLATQRRNVMVAVLVLLVAFAVRLSLVGHNPPTPHQCPTLDGTALSPSLTYAYGLGIRRYLPNDGYGDATEFSVQGVMANSDLQKQGGERFCVRLVGQEAKAIRQPVAIKDLGNGTHIVSYVVPPNRETFLVNVLVLGHRGLLARQHSGSSTYVSMPSEDESVDQLCTAEDVGEGDDAGGEDALWKHIGGSPFTITRIHSEKDIDEQVDRIMRTLKTNPVDKIWVTLKRDDGNGILCKAVSQRDVRAVKRFLNEGYKVSPEPFGSNHLQNSHRRLRWLEEQCAF